MKHLTEEQIVMHCFGDGENSAEISRHLGECSACRESFEQLKAVLACIPCTPVPEPQEGLEREMWLRVRDHLPLKNPALWKRLFPVHLLPTRWMAATALAVLVLAAFMAGRFWPRGPERTKAVPSAQVDAQRVVLVAVGDHLDRSQMFLIELMHTDATGGLDLSREQAQARDLLDSNRLYRLSAQEKSDPGVERMLDQLERVLVEVANAPRDLGEKDLQEIQDRVKSQGLLFKIRVIGSKVRQQATITNQYSGNQRL